MMKRNMKKILIGTMAVAVLATAVPVTSPVHAATVSKGTYDFSNMTVRRVWFNTNDPVFLIDNYERVWLDENVNVIATGDYKGNTKSGNLMAPMKEVFTQLGAEYKEEGNKISITMNGETLVFTIGSKNVTFNGKELVGELTNEQVPERVNVKEKYAAYNTFLTEDYFVTYLPVAYVFNTFQAAVYTDGNVQSFYAAVPIFNTDLVPSLDTAAKGYGARYDALLEGNLAMNKVVADNIVALQNQDGGFQALPANTDLLQANLASRLGTLKDDSTFEDGATVAHLTYLANYIAKKNPSDSKYKEAFVKGIKFLLASQHTTGGWQMSPSEAYGFNGNIVVGNKVTTNILGLLNKLYAGSDKTYTFANDLLDMNKVKAAVEAGTHFLVTSQIENDGVKSGWASQYDETGKVTMGRTYERESVSAFATKDVLQYLMTIKKPSEQVKTAIEAGVAWLKEVKIEGKEQKVVEDTSMNNGFDVYLVDGNGTWASNYVYNEGTKSYRPLYSDVDPTRNDQPYVNTYDLAEVDRKGTNVTSADLILYATRTTVEYYDNDLATALVSTEYDAWKEAINKPDVEEPSTPAPEPTTTPAPEPTTTPDPEATTTPEPEGTTKPGDGSTDDGTTGVVTPKPESTTTPDGENPDKLPSTGVFASNMMKVVVGISAMALAGFAGFKLYWMKKSTEE